MGFKSLARSFKTSTCWTPRVGVSWGHSMLRSRPCVSPPVCHRTDCRVDIETFCIPSCHWPCQSRMDFKVFLGQGYVEIISTGGRTTLVSVGINWNGGIVREEASVWVFHGLIFRNTALCLELGMLSSTVSRVAGLIVIWRMKQQGKRGYLISTGLARKTGFFQETSFFLWVQMRHSGVEHPVNAVFLLYSVAEMHQLVCKCVYRTAL